LFRCLGRSIIYTGIYSLSCLGKATLFIRAFLVHALIIVISLVPAIIKSSTVKEVLTSAAMRVIVLLVGTFVCAGTSRILVGDFEFFKLWNIAMFSFVNGTIVYAVVKIVESTVFSRLSDVLFSLHWNIKHSRLSDVLFSLHWGIEVTYGHEIFFIALILSTALFIRNMKGVISLNHRGLFKKNR